MNQIESITKILSILDNLVPPQQTIQLTKTGDDWVIKVIWWKGQGETNFSSIFKKCKEIGLEVHFDFDELNNKGRVEITISPVKQIKI